MAPDLRLRVCRRLVGPGIAVLLVFGAVAALGRVEFDASDFELGRRLLSGWPRETELRFRGLRPDLLFTGGFVLERAEVSLGSWRIRTPALVVRPALSALLRGRFEPTLIANRFEARLKPKGGLAALSAFGGWVGSAVSVPANVSLRRGNLRTFDGRRLLDRLGVELSDRTEQPALIVHARQRGGGRIDVRGRSDTPGGVRRLDLFVDELEVGDVRGWLARGLGTEAFRLAGRALPATVTGSWHVLGETGHWGASHRFDLHVRPGLAGSANDSASFALRVFGDLQSRSAEWPEALEGWLRMEGAVRRLGTLAVTPGSRDRLVVSGAVGATVRLSAVARERRVGASVELDGAHLRLADWLRKPAGSPASVRLTIEQAPRALPVSAALDIGGLRGEAEFGHGQGLRIHSGWLPAAALVAVSPELEGRIQAGAVRVARLLVGEAGETEALIELRDVELGERLAPIPVRNLSGFVELRDRRLQARGLTGEVSQVPVTMDVEARLPGKSDGAWRVRFGLDAGSIDLARLGTTAPNVRVASAGPLRGDALPPTLRAAALAVIETLGRLRASLKGVLVEHGIIQVTVVELPEETLRDLEVSLALQAQRLDIQRVAFRRAGRAYAYRGSVDLNPLLPKAELTEEARSSDPTLDGVSSAR